MPKVCGVVGCLEIVVAQILSPDFMFDWLPEQGVSI
jgi:hypothetical protein